MENRYNVSLIDLAHSLNHQTDYKEILRLVSIKSTEILNADNTLIMMINPNTQETIKTVLRQDKITDKRILSAQRQITGWMIQEQQSFLTSDIGEDKRFKKLKIDELSGKSVVADLIKVESIVLGSIVAFRKYKANPFNESDLNLLEHLVVIAAPYLRNVKKIKEYFLPDISENALLKKYSQVGLIGESPEFVRLLLAIEAAARSDVRVLLEGESGTGKELIAKAIHTFSERSKGPYVAIDCGTIPGHLLESELFGHKKGAFTGATQDRKGLIQEAEDGVLFIDEIANLPFEIQAKLMRFLQEKEIRPLGSNISEKVNVRIISASSRSLIKMVEELNFRQDLFYRLHVYPIYVPPLRDRERDITLLANFFLNIFTKMQNKKLESFHPDILKFLKNQKWKGNIRELQNFIERMVTMATAEDAILKSNILPANFQNELNLIPSDKSANTKVSLKEQLIHFETHVIRQALDEYNWNQSAAARSLDISEAIIRYRMNKLGIVRER